MTTILLAMFLQAGLQRRDAPVAPTPALNQPGHDTLPDGAEGEYRWRESGEVIELFVQDRHLSGYLTERADKGNARSAPLTFTFTSASAQDEHVQFTTRELHGAVYTFDGMLRPNLRPTEQQGAWLLEGTLTLRSGSTATPEHISAALAPGRR